MTQSLSVTYAGVCAASGRAVQTRVGSVGRKGVCGLMVASLRGAAFGRADPSPSGPGAPAGSIVVTVARRALLQLGVGLTLGAVWGAFLLNRIRWDVTMASPDVPLTVGVTVACTAVVGLLACASPTLRGLRIQPTEALREL
jgi:hypothetical protein